ncbi:MAG TPA: flagellar export chaperone FlgN [Syntrophorhabdaceae bacterium]|nr:flagellar export chaperone FlgN [Syntrophorhabdaceae bacterium]
MNVNTVIEITKKEEKTLKEFLAALRAERDAIISFSLEGIIEGNNRKEEILRKLEYLKTEKERFLENVDDREEITSNRTIQSLNGEMAAVMKEIKKALDKNMKLLSFSIDHVRSSIENIIGHISTIGYGKKREDLSSVLLSKVI